jgi:hypothetical protein
MTLRWILDKIQGREIAEVAQDRIVGRALVLVVFKLLVLISFRKIWENGLLDTRRNYTDVDLVYSKTITEQDDKENRKHPNFNQDLNPWVQRLKPHALLLRHDDIILEIKIKYGSCNRNTILVLPFTEAKPM